MKTAEEYWDEHMAPSGLAPYGGLSYSYRRQAADAMVAAIRADALAEKPAAPDADEERAKREWDRMRGGDSRIFYPYDACNQAEQAAIRTLFAALPPRPMRSPGQVLRSQINEELKRLGCPTLVNCFVSGMDLAKFDAAIVAAATALGIQSKE